MNKIELYIGGVPIRSNVFLAPMAGVTDMAFRGICASMGCGMTYTEMISAKGLSYNNKNTAALLEIHENEKTVAVQLFGSDEKILAETAKRLNDYNADIIDINMGCPASKIIKNGDGASLMKDPVKIGRIVYAVARSSSKPVTVKIRKGFTEDMPNAVKVARIAEDSGAAAICVHGRFASQYYSGEADWNVIGEVKSAVKIPVIGNGDVVSAKDYSQMLKTTGCDAVMIGRGAQGNPWIFKNIAEYNRTGEILPEPTVSEKINMAIFHGTEIIKSKGEYIGIREMRKHLGWYVKSFGDAARLRREINNVKTIDDIKELFSKYMRETML